MCVACAVEDEPFNFPPVTMHIERILLLLLLHVLRMYLHSFVRTYE